MFFVSRDISALVILEAFLWGLSAVNCVNVRHQTTYPPAISAALLHSLSLPVTGRIPVTQLWNTNSPHTHSARAF